MDFEVVAILVLTLLILLLILIMIRLLQLLHTLVIQITVQRHHELYAPQHELQANQQHKLQQLTPARLPAPTYQADPIEVAPIEVAPIAEQTTPAPLRAAEDF